MFNVGGGELLVILLIALIVLGPDKLPEAARKVGRVTAELRRMSNGFQQEIRQAMDLSDQETTPGGAGPSLPPATPGTPATPATPATPGTPAAPAEASPTASDPSVLRPDAAPEGQPTDTGDASAA